MITTIGKQIIHRLAVGNADITGDDFGEIFANAIGGIHAMKPEGIADVKWKSCAWSVKTVKNKKPFSAKKVRLISGRNSPTYSFNVSDVGESPETTGRAVLEIWNERVKQARYGNDNLRVVVLLRNIEQLQFSIFEHEINQYVPADYEWKLNRNRNLIGTEVATGETCFTFQPHGSQFTIHRMVPASATLFSLRRPPTIEPGDILKTIGFQDDWVKIHD